MHYKYFENFLVELTSHLCFNLLFLLLKSLLHRQNRLVISYLNPLLKLLCKLSALLLIVIRNLLRLFSLIKWRIHLILTKATCIVTVRYIENVLVLLYLSTKLTLIKLLLLHLIRIFWLSDLVSSATHS